MSGLQAARRDDREHLEEHARVEMPDVRKPLVRNFAGSSEAIGHLAVPDAKDSEFNDYSATAAATRTATARTRWRSQR